MPPKVLSIIAGPLYPPLALPTSRWKTLPIAPKAGEQVDEDKYSAIIYLKDLTQPKDDDIEQATAARIANRQALIDTISITQQVGIEYSVVSDKGKTTTMRVPIEANEGGKVVLDELDAVIRLARTVYDDPDDLRDYVRPEFVAHFRQELLDSDKSQGDTLERSLQWVDNWAQARYRFMDHFLRDHPDYWEEFHENRVAGDAANRLVHHASLASDCDIVESKWFTDSQREFYARTYSMTPEEGRQLKYCANSPDMQAGYRALFTWIIDFINRVVDWRVIVLRGLVRTECDGGNYWNATPAERKNIKANAFVQHKHRLETVDHHSKTVLDVTKELVKEATTGDRKLKETSFKLLGRAANHVSNAIRNGGNELNVMADFGQGGLRQHCRTWPNNPARHMPHLTETPPEPLDLLKLSPKRRRSRADVGGRGGVRRRGGRA